MKTRIPLFVLAIGLLVVSVTPVSAADSYSYSILHISDLQALSSTHPDTLNYTFSTLESMKNMYNISAIIVTGDLVDNGGNLSQWTYYEQARSLTTIPVYEIPGNHDLNGLTDNPLFDEFVGNKTDWSAPINDFIFLGIGYTPNPLSDSEISYYKSIIEESPQKFSLIAVHNYFDENFSESRLGESIEDNLVLKPTFVLSGHAHATILHSERINNTLYVEDLTNYQADGDFSAGRLYTVYHSGAEVSKITVRDVHIFPRNYLDAEKTVYDGTGLNNYPVDPENDENNYVSPSTSIVSPSPYSPEYFIDPSQIISPVYTKVFAFADRIEDHIDDVVFSNTGGDDYMGPAVDPSQVICPLPPITVF
jgi:hypothetical protein